MPQEKSGTNTGSVKRNSTRKKRPTLSEKVAYQQKIIEQLTADLQQKEEKLTLLNEQSEMISKLNTSLHKLQNLIRKADQKEEQHSQTIEALQQQIADEDKSGILTAQQQAQLIEDLTDKIQEIEIKLSAAYLQNKHIAAQNTVKTHMMAGMSLALLPAPLFDIAALSGTQLNLLRSLSMHYEVDFDENIGKTMITSLISGSLPVLTIVGLSSFAKLIPGIGTLGGGISMTAIAGALIYATGQVFIRHFESGGTIQNFDARHWKNFFREQLEEGKQVLKKKTESTKQPSSLQIDN